MRDHQDPVTGAIKATVYVTGGNAGVRLPLLPPNLQHIRPAPPDLGVSWGRRCGWPNVPKHCAGLPNWSTLAHIMMGTGEVVQEAQWTGLVAWLRYKQCPTPSHKHGATAYKRPLSTL